MDVDATRLGGELTFAEKKKLMDEKKCFFCKEVGHQARQCPRKPRRGPPRARTVETENQGAPSIAPDDSASQTASVDIVSQLRSMNPSERTAAFDQIIEEDLDF
jgi:hypothetical protein